MNEERSKALVAVLSDDRTVIDLCREICEEAGGAIVTAGAGSPPPIADHYVWDARPGVELPDELILSCPERHLILVDRAHLAWLGEKRLTETMVVLKPVARPNLAAFLIHALASGRQRWKQPPRDRYALLESLLQATIRLQEYDQDRTTFLACAAHEFRVPLTAVVGYCDLLLSGSAGALGPEHREIVSRMQRSAQRLSRLASGMHLLSLGQRAPAPDLQPHTMEETVGQAVHECHTFLEDKKAAVEISIQPSPRQLWFERGQIEQVLVNLIENACGHVARGGSLRIRAYPWFWERRGRNDSLAGPDRRSGQPVDSPNAYRVDVFDDGPGMTEQELAGIFEEYVSRRPAHVRPGSGLGLAICRQILARHSGAIWAEPCPGGKQFAFVLPYRAESRPAGGAVLQAGASVGPTRNEINIL